MRRYSIDTNERKKVYYYLAIVSLGVSIGIGYFKEIDPYQLIAPSSFMIFVVLLSLYNNYVWKWSSKIGLSDIPNLNGIWEGIVKRSGGEEYTSKMIITQNWEKIDVSIESNLTTGTVEVVGIFIENKNRKKLKLIYQVRARALDIEGYHPYGEGVNELVLREENNTIEMDGFFYSSKKSTGKLKFKRIE